MDETGQMGRVGGERGRGAEVRQPAGSLGMGRRGDGSRLWGEPRSPEVAGGVRIQPAGEGREGRQQGNLRSGRGLRWERPRGWELKTWPLSSLKLSSSEAAPPENSAVLARWSF